MNPQYSGYELEDGNQGKSLQGYHNWTGDLLDPFSSPGVLLGLPYHCYFGQMDHSVEPEGEENEELGPVNSVAVKVILDNRSAFKGFLRRHLSSESEAEDLLQQSLLKAIRNADDLVDNEKVTAWFYRILRNSLTDFYRSRAADGRRNDGLLQELVALGEDHQAAPDAELMGEVCACMNRLLPALKPEYADLLKRIDLLGEAPAEVATQSGITYNNLMVRLHRARQALRKSLVHTCGACTLHGCLDCTCRHEDSHAHSR